MFLTVPPGPVQSYSFCVFSNICHVYTRTKSQAISVLFHWTFQSRIQSFTENYISDVSVVLAVISVVCFLLVVISVVCFLLVVMSVSAHTQQKKQFMGLHKIYSLMVFALTHYGIYLVTVLPSMSNDSVR